MKRSSIAIIGAGRLGSALATTLRTAGYRITEIVSQESRRSFARAQSLARSTGAKAATSKSALLNAEIVWFCVPDGQITAAARQFSERHWKGKVTLHSSGVLSSQVLAGLRKKGARVASAHPLMTFAPGWMTDLAGVSFAIEGDPPAVLLASEIVRSLKGRPVRIRPHDKVAYHAFATMVCPLLVSLLAASEEAAALAGISAREARRRMVPIVRQTIANYEKLGPATSFTGPIVRGDVETIRRHFDVLATIPDVRDVYATLVQASLKNLPNRNAEEILKALRANSFSTAAGKAKALNRKGRKETRHAR